MKTFLIVFFSILFLNGSLNGQTVNANYDSTLAKSLNAYDYGMKSYILVLLKPGSNTSTDKILLDSIFTGHMKNINILANNGKLVVAGPIEKNETYRGIFILNVETVEVAQKLLETDPAVKEKFLDPEMFVWYGSAALQENLKLHRRIEKYSF
ncbi:MAG: hypothetical protein M3R36_17940 [Bacteroidota bacterium]|nr:hypothetical protein [Bacteroidota bacterium]